MKKILALLLVATAAKLATAQDSTALKLDELVTAYAKLDRFNGSVLIAKDNHILLAKGYGFNNAGTKTMNDTNTVFQVASITKSFTSTVVLKLAELKKLRLDDKLSQYYKGFPNGDSITVEMLLNHTAGLRNFTEEDSTIQETDERRMIPYLKTLRPDFAPGRGWNYSNTNYVMLGYIIQKASGLNYWQAVRRYIFDPLEMKSSGFDFAHLKSKEKAFGYDAPNDSVQRPLPITDSTVPSAAGAIYSTVADMYKWYKGMRENKIISAASFSKATTPSALHDYGFGWQIDTVFGKKIASHSGAITGFGSNFACNFSDNVCIVLLSNRNGSTFNVMRITDKILAVLYHQPYAVPVKRTPVAIDEKALQRYKGVYLIKEINVCIELSSYNGRLIAQPSRDGHPGPTSFLLAIDDTHFYDARDEELQVDADVDESGNVKGFCLLQKGAAKYAKKIN